MPAKRKRWTTSARVAFFAAIVAWPIATACSGGSTPPTAGSGDDVINDTRDAQPNPVNPDPGDDAGPDANANEGPTYDSEGGAYPGVAECSSCTCDPAKYYCFGGATARAALRPFAKDAGAGGDAGLPACPIVDASTPQLGCNPIPAGCATSPTPCGCIISALQPAYSCYLDCAGGAGEQMTAYCGHY